MNIRCRLEAEKHGQARSWWWKSAHVRRCASPAGIDLQSRSSSTLSTTRITTVSSSSSKYWLGRFHTGNLSFVILFRKRSHAWLFHSRNIFYFCEIRFLNTGPRTSWTQGQSRDFLSLEIYFGNKNFRRESGFRIVVAGRLRSTSSRVYPFECDVIYGHPPLNSHETLRRHIRWH